MRISGDRALPLPATGDTVRLSPPQLVVAAAAAAAATAALAALEVVVVAALPTECVRRTDASCGRMPCGCDGVGDCDCDAAEPALMKYDSSELAL